MCPASKMDSEIQTWEDPYERFMLHHLKYYGLFTGRDDHFQGSSSLDRRWELNSGSILSDHSPDSTDSGSDSAEEEQVMRRRSRPFSQPLQRALNKTRQLVFDIDGNRSIPRLREPRGLFAVPSVLSSQQGVRWPIECEVIKQEIQHIEWDPPEAEPFYQPTGHERTPMPVGEEKGKVVYCIDTASKSSCFTYSRVGGRRGMNKCAATCLEESDHNALVFESRFQSGNLQRAVQVGLHDYELTLRTDMYTTKHTQWFYFQVRNMKAGLTYRFTIINLMKSGSLYCLGMKPLLYSERGAQTKGMGWCRAGSNIKYYRNSGEREGKPLYSLTWTCQFPHELDTCYFAHCYPYTYSDLQQYLLQVVTDPAAATYCKQRVLCRSLAGNAVHVLTITSPAVSREAERAKRAVVVTARVHPGETNSSWIMQGFLDFLLSDSPDAWLLRDTFVFKVVPMLNPDGVVVGNYRCSLAGRDLNRNYHTLLRESFPCVWHTRNMVKRLMAEREVALYCDFHGHSRKSNVFMYGCDSRAQKALRLHARIFPLMMSKNAADKFSYKSCKFRVQKSKEGTGRIVMWKLGILNSYTMESTFGGSTLGNRKGTHFTTRDLKSLGYCFGDTLLDYCDPDPAKVSQCLKELGSLFRQEVLEKLGRHMDSDGSLSSVSMSDIESSTSGSNSTGSDGLPVHLLNLTNTSITPKKKFLKTRKERNRLRQEQAKRSDPKAILQNNKTPTVALTSKEVLKLRSQAVTVRENQKREKNAYVDTRTAAYMRSGGALDSAKQPVSEELQSDGNRHRHPAQLSGPSPLHRPAPRVRPLILTAVQQQQQVSEGPTPIQQRPFTFSLNYNTAVRGRFTAPHTPSYRSSAASRVSQSNMVSEVIPLRGLVPLNSCHPITPALRQKPRQPINLQPKQVSIKYHLPEASTGSSDSMENINRKQEGDNAVNEPPPLNMKLQKERYSYGVPVPENTADQPAANMHSFLPDLKRHSGDHAREGVVKLGDSDSFSQVPLLGETGKPFSFLQTSLANPSHAEQPPSQRGRLQRLQKLNLTKASRFRLPRTVMGKGLEVEEAGEPSISVSVSRTTLPS